MPAISRQPKLEEWQLEDKTQGLSSLHDQNFLLICMQKVGHWNGTKGAEIEWKRCISVDLDQAYTLHGNVEGMQTLPI